MGEHQLTIRDYKSSTDIEAEMSMEIAPHDPEWNFSFRNASLERRFSR
jgi:hypothetical protein